MLCFTKLLYRNHPFFFLEIQPELQIGWLVSYAPNLDGPWFDGEQLAEISPLHLVIIGFFPVYKVHGPSTVMAV